jgi:hypothetical protein
MAKIEFAIEYKSGHVSRPQLNQIVGAALRSRPEVDEIIIRCPSAARTVWAAVDEINAKHTLLNSSGRPVKVTVADEHRRGRG